jgi:predicted transcriptional regulator
METKREHRRPDEIEYDILQMMKRRGWTMKTKLIYMNNLNHKVFKKYMDKLLRTKLADHKIVVGPHNYPHSYFNITERGLEYLVYYSKLRKYLP